MQITTDWMITSSPLRHYEDFTDVPNIDAVIERYSQLTQDRPPLPISEKHKGQDVYALIWLSKVRLDLFFKLEILSHVSIISFCVRAC